MKKYMDLCQHAKKYKQVVLETISRLIDLLYSLTDVIQV